MLLVMDWDTLALSALLRRNSRAHGLVKLPPFASSYQELSEKNLWRPSKQERENTEKNPHGQKEGAVLKRCTEKQPYIYLSIYLSCTKDSLYLSFFSPSQPSDSLLKRKRRIQMGDHGSWPHCHPPALNQSDQWMLRVLSNVVTAFKTRVITWDKVSISERFH